MKMAGWLLCALAAATLAAAPAVARTKDKAGSGYCASGKHVTDTKQCKENGGTR